MPDRRSRGRWPPGSHGTGAKDAAGKKMSAGTERGIETMYRQRLSDPADLTSQADTK
jgi:hypothetical protein